MRLLLDTCTFLWMAIDAPQLSARARELFADPVNDLFLSSISSFEIALKHSLGSLPLPEPPGRYVPTRRQTYGVQSLPLDEESALHLARLPKLHSDPFDRLLICQASIHGLGILTPDEAIAQYPVRTLW